MIVDPSKKSNESFNPNPDNTTFHSQSSSRDKTLWWSLVVIGYILFLIPGILLTWKWISSKNTLRKQQVEVNEAASAIDVNLAKRRDTLIKLLDECKGYMKFEKETMSQITELRSFKGTNGDISKANDVSKIMDNISRDFNINVENYPNLKSSTIVLELTSATQYIESEIASSRRLYNLKVTAFNQNLVAFPMSVAAASLNLHSLPLFVASEEQRKDVDMTSLSNV